MNFMSLYTDSNDDLLLQSDVLAVFREDEKKGNEIEEGMQPDEMAEITSDHFIAAVKQQFEEAKKEFVTAASSVKKVKPEPPHFQRRHKV